MNKMASSPLNETGVKKVDLCTPIENLHKHCQEITPDNPIQPTTEISFGVKKVLVVYQSLHVFHRFAILRLCKDLMFNYEYILLLLLKASAVGHYQKLSKRKLFEFPVSQTEGKE